MGEEPADVRLDPNGDVTVLIGTQSSGQGHATAYAQIIADQFGIPPERVHMIQGDTDVVVTGLGTGGSSSIPSGGVSVERATRKLGAQLREIASEALETSAADLEISDGSVRIAGTDRSISFADLAKRADPSKLTANESFSSADGTYPNGTHLVEVEIDPATGKIQLVNYVIVDDFGVTLNPLLLAGQVHGGTMQGIGQALMEQAVYDAEDGQLVTGTFMDYALPRAADGTAIHLRDPQRPLRHQSSWGEGRGRSRRHRLVPGGGQCHRRWPVAGVRDRPHRHAGHARAGLDGDPGSSAAPSDVRNGRSRGISRSGFVLRLTITVPAAVEKTECVNGITLPSLRGASRRSNPERSEERTGLLRFTRKAPDFVASSQ